MRKQKATKSPASWVGYTHHALLVLAKQDLILDLKNQITYMNS